GGPESEGSRSASVSGDSCHPGHYHSVLAHHFHRSPLRADLQEARRAGRFADTHDLHYGCEPLNSELEGVSGPDRIHPSHWGVPSLEELAKRPAAARWLAIKSARRRTYLPQLRFVPLYKNSRYAAALRHTHSPCPDNRPGCDWEQGIDSGDRSLC